MIEFQSLDFGDLEAVQAFLAENGWEKRVADSERFQRMIENANRTVVAVDGDRIVGFARALCDDVERLYRNCRGRRGQARTRNRRKDG